MSSLRATAVVIGGSAGSLASLLAILKELPATYQPSLFLAVHVPPNDRSNTLVGILQAHCLIHVGEAEDKEPIEGGCVYIAPPNYHLLIENTGSLALSSDEPVWFSRPSIDVLFESAAEAYGEELVGIVLSGASHDGARGLRAVEQGGGVVIVEDPATAYAAVMPRSAFGACPAARVATAAQIATYLKHL